jgi:hypothetical protein
MKPAFLISMFGAQATAVPAGFGSSGLAIGAQIAAPIHCERFCLRLVYAYELAGKGSRRACSRDTIGCDGLKRLPERPLLPQIRRSRTHIEMTGVRPTEASKAAVCYVRFTSIQAVRLSEWRPFLALATLRRQARMGEKLTHSVSAKVDALSSA